MIKHILKSQQRQQLKYRESTYNPVENLEGQKSPCLPRKEFPTSMSHKQHIFRLGRLVLSIQR
jgi:hypothetical protein